MYQRYFLLSKNKKKKYQNCSSVHIILICYRDGYFHNITKTRPCNIQRFLKLSKMQIFSRKILIFFLFLPRRFYRVPTIYVLEQKQEKMVFPCIPQFCHMKVGFKGVFITWTCFCDEDFAQVEPNLLKRPRANLPKGVK